MFLSGLTNWMSSFLNMQITQICKWIELQAMWKSCTIISPSIQALPACVLWRVVVGWSLSQLALGERRSRPWTTIQPVAWLKQRQPFRYHTFSFKHTPLYGILIKKRHIWKQNPSSTFIWRGGVISRWFGSPWSSLSPFHYNSILPMSSASGRWRLLQKHLCLIVSGQLMKPGAFSSLLMIEWMHI